LLDLAAQAFAFIEQRERRAMDLAGGSTGFGRAAPDVLDAGRYLGGALRGVLDIARNLLRRRALFFDRRRDGRCDFRHRFDRTTDLLDRADRLLGGCLDLCDLAADLLGRRCGLIGKRLHLGGDDGKAPARFAGTRGLDGGVERQQIGLLGDGGDQLNDVADAAGGVRSAAMRASVLSACFTASKAILVESCTRWPISATDELIWPVARATDWTLADAWSEATATLSESRWVVSAVFVNVPAAVSSFAEAVDTISMMPPTVASNSLASLCFTVVRAASLALYGGFSFGRFALVHLRLVGGQADLSLALL